VAVTRRARDAHLRGDGRSEEQLAAAVVSAPPVQRLPTALAEKASLLILVKCFKVP
jgi:hypothetical protein